MPTNLLRTATWEKMIDEAGALRFLADIKNNLRTNLICKWLQRRPMRFGNACTLWHSEIQTLGISQSLKFSGWDACEEEDGSRFSETENATSNTHGIFVCLLVLDGHGMWTAHRYAHSIPCMSRFLRFLLVLAFCWIFAGEFLAKLLETSRNNSLEYTDLRDSNATRSLSNHSASKISGSSSRWIRMNS